MTGKAISRLTLAAAVVAGGSLATSAQADYISEYFNDYGTSTINVEGLNGGTGFSSGWAYTTASRTVSYTPTAGLSYAGAGYSNLNNQTDSNDGGVTSNVTTNSSGLAFRNINPGLTGTIWVSALVQIATSGTTSTTLLWLDQNTTDGGNNSGDFVGIFQGNIAMRYNATTTLTSAGAPTTGTAHLVLAKIIINASGNNDSLSMWFDPVLTGGVAGLGAATYTSSSADTFGTAFDGIGVQVGAVAGNSKIDAIRISNEADAFNFVTTGQVPVVPEPASLALLGLGGLLALPRRSKKA